MSASPENGPGDAGQHGLFPVCDPAERDATRLYEHGPAVEVGLVVGETQGASLLPALPGAVASEGFVGGVVLSRLPDYPDRMGNEPVVAGVESG